jgi:pyruvate formate lyase activating enzyme
MTYLSDSFNIRAAFQTTMTEGILRCDLCPRHCQIKPKQTGYCGTRFHDGTQLVAINYGQVMACHLDPIEKKPLRTFYPGRQILSVGSFGCNYGCPFCQNHELSMWRPDVQNRIPRTAVAIAPEKLVATARQMKDNLGLAFTYNEPTIWFEYIRDCAPLLKDAGLKLVLVSNGYIEVEPLLELLPFIDAMNIDLKTINAVTAKKMNGGDPELILRTIATASRFCTVEVTTLLVTDLTDDPEMIGKLAERLALINPDIPLHLSRYYPAFRYNAPATPIERIRSAAASARAYLKNVFVGNCPPGLEI